jgi:hypothetical protein
VLIDDDVDQAISKDIESSRITHYSNQAIYTLIKWHTSTNAGCAQKLFKLMGNPGKFCEFGCKEFETKGFTKLAPKIYLEKGIFIVSSR